MDNFQLLIRQIVIPLELCWWIGVSVWLSACGGKSDNNEDPRIDCDSFTTNDFLQYYSRDFACWNATFCMSDSVGTECIEYATELCSVDSFLLEGDGWNSSVACQCAQSMEDSRREAESMDRQELCDSGYDPYREWDCPEDWLDHISCDSILD
jgi:hypothetical protein